MPEHDLALANAEQGRRSGTGAVAPVSRPVPEEKSRADAGLPLADVHDSSGAGASGIPADRVIPGSELEDATVLDDARVLGEEVGSTLVVARVERLAPCSDDALRRRATAAATGSEGGQKQADRGD